MSSIISMLVQATLNNNPIITYNTFTSARVAECNQLQLGAISSFIAFRHRLVSN